MKPPCVAGLVCSIAFLFLASGGAQAAPLSLSVSLPPIASADMLTGLQFQASIVLVGNDITTELIPSLQLTEMQSYLRPGFSCSGGKGGGKCVPTITPLTDSSSSLFAAYKPGDSFVGDFYFSLTAPQSIDFFVALTNPINFGTYGLQLIDLTGGNVVAPDGTTASTFSGLAGNQSFDLRFSTTSFSADGLTITGTLKPDVTLPVSPAPPPPPPAPTPEPSSLLLLGTGVLFVGRTVTRRVAQASE